MNQQQQLAALQQQMQQQMQLLQQLQQQMQQGAVPPPGAAAVPGGAPPQVAQAGLAGGPQAPPVAPGGVVPPLGGQQMSPYRTLYADASNDSFAANYAAAYSEFEVPVQGNPANTPAELAAKVLDSGNEGTHMAMVGLVRSRVAPAAVLGVVQAYHRLTRFGKRLGLPNTPFDDQAHAFLGDLVNGQAPTSVTLQPAYFHPTDQTRVPTPAALDQLIAAHPDTEIFGPFAATDADTELVRTRRMMLIPSKYLPIVLDHGITAKQAWLRIRGSMVTQGDAAACQPFIDWLRMALTSNNAVGVRSRLAMEHPSVPSITAPEDAVTFTNYRWSFINRDLPNLRTTPVTAEAHQIALGLNMLVTEQRLQRQADETRRDRERTKTPTEFFSPGIRKLMRWCQVLDETDLPPIYAQLASAKKGTHRLTLQQAIADTCENANLSHLDIQISTGLAKRIVDLDWASSLTDDLSIGLHPFAIGYVTEEEAKVQREQNREADMIAIGEAGASLSDTQAVLGTASVHIPTRHTHAKVSHQRAHMLWITLLGSEHSFTQRCKTQADEFVSREAELELSSNEHAPETPTISSWRQRSSLGALSWTPTTGSAVKRARMKPYPLLTSRKAFAKSN